MDTFAFVSLQQAHRCISNHRSLGLCKQVLVNITSIESIATIPAQEIEPPSAPSHQPDFPASRAPP